MEVRSKTLNLESLMEAPDLNDLNGAHPSTLSGRAEDRAGHGEPAEPLNDWNDLNGLRYFIGAWHRFLCSKFPFESDFEQLNIEP
jgi:hypothetical protein